MHLLLLFFFSVVVSSTSLDEKCPQGVICVQVLYKFVKRRNTSIFSNNKQAVSFTHICNAEIRNTKANQSSSKSTTLTIVKHDY